MQILAELAKKLPTGRLYSTGRGFVPSVGPSLYGKLVEQLKLAGQPVPGEAEQPNGDQSGTAQAAPGLPSQLGRRCCRPPGDRPGRRNGTAGGRPSSSPATATC